MTTPEQKKRLTDWFFQLQNDVIAELELIEKEFSLNSNDLPKFEKKTWKRGLNGADEGGGTMAVMRGQVFEKVGVNVSTVYGEFPPEFAKNIPGAINDPTFWASGTSFVAHPRNPFVPIAHMNTRHITTTVDWFGGGGDLTPVFPFDEDTALFHDSLRAVCDQYGSNYYPRFKQWCDEYFYIKHRNEPRGVGGIFFDDHNTGDFEADFAFIKSVGIAFLNAYATIVRRRMNASWGIEHQKVQSVKRARYAEFNLIYDRGTQFGLKTNGNTEAILMSLPPMATWE